MQPVPLVQTTRGYPEHGFTVENTHLGSVAVVNARGALLWSAGDPHAIVFTRSALKPFQALPFVLADGPAHFGLSSAELALLCASHSAEDKHVQAVESILAKIGLDESHLACGCHAPLYYDSVGKPLPPGQVWRPVHHNCSGKHSGFLAWCRLHGAPTAGYLDPSHRLQQSIRHTLAGLTGLPADQLPMGMDGCSAPNFAMPLSRLAHLFARLAQGSADPVHGAAMGDLCDAMRGHPDMVSGQARADLAYMSAGCGDWVSKIGADAVQTIGIRSAGLGIAIKIADGAKHVLQSATVSVLEQLGVMDSVQQSLLAHYRNPPLRNARQAVVGAIEPVFTLQAGRL
ncbi:asparaginase [Massilia sp. CF038]|uniref:asparaginase n=1 Tax=Massilia sp. CF038 TaxID=1881045 RepID=UPI0009229FB2|nr:asparaginase [Massilia sp. CF038]SHH18896.1 asparaginase [Massilia sp. CF038]